MGINLKQKDIYRFILVAAIGTTSLVGLNVAAGADTGLRVAVFDFELIDTSLQGEIHGESRAETTRLHLISDLLRQLLVNSGRYQPLDLSPVSSEIEKAGWVNSCNGCAVQIARKIDATQAITGTVQKVSALILNINIYVYDVKSGKLINSMTADIRGNTDKSWSRGLRWLVRHRLLNDI